MLLMPVDVGIVESHCLAQQYIANRYNGHIMVMPLTVWFIFTFNISKSKTL